MTRAQIQYNGHHVFTADQSRIKTVQCEVSKPATDIHHLSEGICDPVNNIQSIHGPAITLPQHNRP